MVFIAAFILLNAFHNQILPVKAFKPASSFIHIRYLARIPIPCLSVSKKDQEADYADIHLSVNQEHQLQSSLNWNRRNFFIVGAVSAFPFIPKYSAAFADNESKNEGYQTVTLPSGLKYIELREGTGPTPRYGQLLTIGYTGYVKVATKKSTANANEPPPVFDKVDAYLVKHGNRRLIPGLEEGIHTVRYSTGFQLLSLLSTITCA
jgi:hypothetical protein